jgi:hypothetical protein
LEVAGLVRRKGVSEGVLLEMFGEVINTYQIAQRFVRRVSSSDIVGIINISVQKGQ